MTSARGHVRHFWRGCSSFKNLGHQSTGGLIFENMPSPRRFLPLLFCTAHLVLNALVDDLGALFGR